MPASVHFGMEALFGFLLTFTRVGSALILVPIPGFQSAPQAARIVLIASTTVCLFPVWPVVQVDSLSGGQFAMAVLAETAAGMLLGLAISFLNETFQLTAQTISMQAGFSFASTIDPNSQADTNVFQLMTQLTTGLLFFGLGVHQNLIRFFAQSFNLYSPDHVMRDASIRAILSLGGLMLITGLKMGLPVVTLLFLVDLALAVLGRLQSQLQLITLAFPAKIVLSFIFLTAIMVRWPALYQQAANQVLDVVSRLVTH